ncbi:hypothetical protein [Roseobacter sinensis]|uniref:Lipoprotein n=1 Tax=Roseobacter sinensis TaxID=2931391 RepID=A0ABT3BGM4_9RHOB|nr:hypothetical protein [Roseobacter sp. WL0113]MCV3272736.1 hypothetical protein [Roseobacter sp. WL0113]
MRALLFLVVTATAAAADPVADLVRSAAMQGRIYLDFHGPQPDGTCAAEAFLLARHGAEWHLETEGSEGVFRLRPWPDGGPLHLTHNPRSGGFVVMQPQHLGVPDVALFRPALRCPAGANAEAQCTAVDERYRTLVHMVSLIPACDDAG